MAASVELESDATFPEAQPVDAADDSWPSGLSDRCAALFFQVASCLTNPICKTHEFYRRIQVSAAENPEASHVERCANQFFLLFGLVSFGLAASITTLPGIFLRYLALSLQVKPFLYFRGDLEEQPFPESLTLLSWNICCVPGGYAISDGGVAPWPFRIDRVIDKIRETDADTLCLYEVFDMDAAMHLYDKLKDKYAHFYFNVGPKAVGASSGMFVASKFKITRPEYTPFSQEMLVGRTKNCNKGIFAFDHNNSVRIFTTHLQHSEECQFPTEEEVEARKREMALIIEKIDQIRDRAIILTGDLNLDDEEYRTAFWSSRFEKGILHYQNKTWGGDAFCAELVGKRASGPLNLDHTMALEDSVRNFETYLIETAFDAEHYSLNALSDHGGLYSIIHP